MAAMAINAPMGIHPTMSPLKPYHKTMSYGSWGATAIFENMEFINFYERTS